MKSILFIWLFLFMAFNGFSQFEVKKQNEQIILEGFQDNKFSELRIINNPAPNTVLKIVNNALEKEFDECENVGPPDNAFSLKTSSTKEISFYVEEGCTGSFLPLYVCNGTFSQAPCLNEVKQTIDITQIPIPQFKYFDTNVDNKDVKVLVIDANPDPAQRNKGNLYKLKDNELNLTNNYLKKGSNLTVYIKNYNFENLEDMTVLIDGEDWSYTKDIKDMRSSVDSTVETGDERQEAVKEDDTKNNGNASVNGKYLAYLDKAYSKLSKIDSNSMNINDFFKLRQYQKALEEDGKNLIANFTGDELNKYYNILQIYPEYISLTTMPYPIPNKDEVKIEIKFKEKQGDQIKEIASPAYVYKTTGGYSTYLSNSLFVTNLVNPAITTIQDGDRIVADLEESRESSVGIGLNYAINWRLCPWFRPGLSFGMFVPFDEDITPILAFGYQQAFVFKEFKFSFGGGVAGGLMDGINTKYIGKDLRDFPNYVEDIYVKQPKLGWQVNLGFNYNL